MRLSLLSVSSGKLQNASWQESSNERRFFVIFHIVAIICCCLLKAFSNSVFSETSGEEKLLEMNNNVRAKYSRKGIIHLHAAFIKLERVVAHGRIKLPIKMIVHPISKKEKQMSRNRPSGSFAKKSGRKASKWRVIFRKADGSSKGPRKAGRC